MRRINRIGVAMLLLSFPACGDGSVEADQAPTGGVLEVSGTAEQGLLGSLSLANEIVLFEARREPGTVTEDDGSERQWSIVARFFDVNGDTLASLAEGHAIPVEWQSVPLEGVSSETVKLVGQAAEALAAASVDQSVEKERSLLVYVGRDLERGEAMKAELPTLPRTPGVRAAGCQYMEMVEAFSKPAFFSFMPYDHTATKIWFYGECGSGVYQVGAPEVFCNHGTCPGSMSRYDYGFSEWTTSGVVVPFYCDSWGYSYGFAGSGHVCNQDTFLEMGYALSKRLANGSTADKICNGSNYQTYTGRSKLYRPTVANVRSFISKYGWGSVPPPPPDCIPADCPLGWHCCGDTCYPPSEACPR